MTQPTPDADTAASNGTDLYGRYEAAIVEGLAVRVLRTSNREIAKAIITQLAAAGLLIADSPGGDDHGPRYDRDQVLHAVNQAADLVIDQIDGGMVIDDDDHTAEDAVYLVVNATMTLLERPQATPAEIVEENYDEGTWEL